jgi:hypothetical protein
MPHFPARGHRGVLEGKVLRGAVPVQVTRGDLVGISAPLRGRDAVRRRHHRRTSEARGAPQGRGRAIYARTRPSLARALRGAARPRCGVAPRAPAQAAPARSEARAVPEEGSGRASALIPRAPPRTAAALGHAARRARKVSAATHITRDPALAADRAVQRTTEYETSPRRGPVLRMTAIQLSTPDASRGASGSRCYAVAAVRTGAPFPVAVYSSSGGSPGRTPSCHVKRSGASPQTRIHPMWMARWCAAQSETWFSRR